MFSWWKFQCVHVLLFPHPAVFQTRRQMVDRLADFFFFFLNKYGRKFKAVFLLKMTKIIVAQKHSKPYLVNFKKHYSYFWSGSKLLIFCVNYVKLHNEYVCFCIYWFLTGSQKINITKTYLYNFDPLKPHFYIVKLGFRGVYIIFLISAQNLDCGYSLEPPRQGEAVLTSTHNLGFEQKYEKYLKIFSFWRWNFLYIWIGVFS